MLPARVVRRVQCARLLPWKMKWIEFGREACMIDDQLQNRLSCTTRYSHYRSTCRPTCTHCRSSGTCTSSTRSRSRDYTYSRRQTCTYIHHAVMSVQCSTCTCRHALSIRMGACTAWHYRAESKKRRCRNGRRWILELFSMLAHSSKLVRLETCCI